jgi:hypothetical protein
MTHPSATLRGLSALLLLALPACAGGGPSSPGGSGVGSSFSESDGEDLDDESTGDDETTASPPDSTEDAESSTAADDTTTAGDDPPDLSMGTWTFENISMTSAMGFHPRRALTDDGDEVVAWAEGAVDDFSTLNIHTARRNGGAWSSTERLTNYVGVQNTFPVLVAAPTPILAWTGRRVGGDDDVFIATALEGGWSEIRNVSDSLEPAIEARADLKPALAAADDGRLAIAYLSSQITDGGMDTTPELFVSEFTLDADPIKRLPLVDSTTTACTEVTGAAAPSGVFHFVALCVQNGASVLLQATNRSGEWTTDPMSGLGTAILSPSMVRARDGVHLTWVQRQPCGTESCYEVFHSATNDEVFGTPVAVTNEVNLDERRPTVGVDPWGRVLVVHQANLDGVGGLYLSISEDEGATFESLGRISPAGADDDYETPTSIGFDADGMPSFALEVVEDGSDPLNVDIHVARFVPA